MGLNNLFVLETAFGWFVRTSLKEYVGLFGDVLAGVVGTVCGDKRYYVFFRRRARGWALKHSVVECSVDDFSWVVDFQKPVLETFQFRFDLFGIGGEDIYFLGHSEWYVVFNVLRVKRVVFEVVVVVRGFVVYLGFDGVVWMQDQLYVEKIESVVLPFFDSSFHCEAYAFVQES